MLSNPKHVSTLPSSVDIINGIFFKSTIKKEATNPYKADIKDGLVLNDMTWEAADDIE